MISIPSDRALTICSKHFYKILNDFNHKDLTSPYLTFQKDYRYYEVSTAAICRLVSIGTRTNSSSIFF